MYIIIIIIIKLASSLTVYHGAFPFPSPGFICVPSDVLSSFLSGVGIYIIIFSQWSWYILSSFLTGVGIYYRLFSVELVYIIVFSQWNWYILSSFLSGIDIDYSLLRGIGIYYRLFSVE